MSFRVVPASTYTPEVRQWVWQDRIPSAALTVISADPGSGKTTIAIDLAARVTRGWAMPDVAGVIPIDAEDGDDPAPALYIGLDDHLRQDLIPRFHAARADLSRLHHQDIGQSLTLPADADALGKAIEAVGARLVVLDTLVRTVNPLLDLTSYQQATQAIAPLQDVAGVDRRCHRGLEPPHQVPRRHCPGSWPWIEGRHHGRCPLRTHHRTRWRWWR